MKLRLETGNFSIKALLHNPNTTRDIELITTTLPKGLSYMDFIGTVVDFGVSAEVIAWAITDSDHDGYVLLGLSSNSAGIVYNQATGEISLSESGDPINPVPVDPDNGGDDSGDSGDDPVDPGNGSDAGK